MKKASLFLVFLALVGCFQTYSDEDDLNTVPITNNPHIIPNYGSSMTGGAPGAPQ